MSQSETDQLSIYLNDLKIDPTSPSIIDSSKELLTTRVFMMKKENNKIIRIDDMDQIPKYDVRIHLPNLCNCNYTPDFGDIQDHYKLTYQFKQSPINNTQCIYVPIEDKDDPECLNKNLLLKSFLVGRNDAICSTLLKFNPNGGSLICGSKETLEKICFERNKFYNKLMEEKKELFEDVCVELVCCRHNMNYLKELVKLLTIKYNSVIDINYLTKIFFECKLAFNTMSVKNIRKNNKFILLNIEFDQKTNAYQICFPQGKRNFGEGWISAAHRECMEETLIDFDFNTFYTSHEKNKTISIFDNTAMGYRCFDLDDYDKLIITFKENIMKLSI
jgi:hypothetical protein